MDRDVSPGCYLIPNDDYHHGPGVSKSSLDLVHKAPALFEYATGPDAEPRESTPAQVFGSAYHAIVLEPEVFARTYCLALRPQDEPDAIEDRDQLVQMVQKLNASRLPKLPTSGSKGDLVDRIISALPEHPGIITPPVDELPTLKGAELKGVIDHMNERRDGLLPVSGTRHELADLLRANGVSVTLWSDVQAEWLKNNSDKIVLSDDDWKTLHAMRDALMRHPAASRILRRPGRAEQSFYWRDPATGALCRCRPDYFTDCGIVADLKSALDASEDGFCSAVQSHRYDVQHPFYVDGINHAIDQARIDRAKAREFVFIAQEKKPPYLVGVWSLDPEDVELGRMEYRADLKTLHQCRQAKRFPGYGDGVRRLSLKAWHRQQTAIAAQAVLQ